MAIVLNEIPHSIGTYFDDDNPLGPVAAEYIGDREVAAYLITLENDAFGELFQGTPILFGRKGAGKSSIINSFQYAHGIKSQTALALDRTPKAVNPKSETDLRRDYDIIVKVDASREISHVHAQVRSSSLPLPELAAAAWTRRLWLNALSAVSVRPDLIDKFEPQLKQLLIKLSSMLSRLVSTDGDSHYFDEWLDLGKLSIPNADVLLAELRKAFEAHKLSVLFLIDTMEEYNLLFDDALKTTIGGLLYLVGRHDKHIHYKVAFPYEIFDSVRLEGNPEKFILRSTTIRWTPTQLVHIVTRRMLLCLYLYDNESLAEILAEGKYTEGRRANFEFWGEIFGGEIVNEAHDPEPPLYYVLRHTQLLPRQLINSLSRLVKLSKTELRSFRHINPEVIEESMKISSNDLVGGVESGFKHTYTGIGEVFETYLSRCDVVMTYGDMHKAYASSSVKRGPEYTHSFYDFLRALLHMGVFGVIVGEGTTKYIEAAFSYGDDTVMRAFQERSFAMHPAFSLLYKQPDDRLKPGRAVLPLGSNEGLE
ncbi:MAG TPA: hypothetical protein VK614_14635 [Allosphingosinicella sp.]|nr:hypothetical protein [Allosphingosinicella sp.]